jgi:RNase adaptor protein for sRNA GlmZ degradation
VEAFYGHCRGLVEAQVRAYLARGFSSLSVLFGCTGGRHRSVWLAERLARDLAAAFPGIHLRCEHGERAKWGTALRAAP